MGYSEAYRFIFSLKRFGGGRGLESIQKSLSSLGNPHHKFPSIHVAGTNGKGSVSAILDSILRESGFSVGLYSSPHLLKVNERIKVDGREIEDQTFASVVTELADIIRRDDLTFFEALTLIAFKVFHDKGIEIGIIEVGLGGRLDATNLVNSVLTLVTNIGLDHTAYLGNDLQSIAMEKLGIVKKGIPLVTGVEGEDLKEMFESVAMDFEAPIHFIDDEVKYAVSKLTFDGIEFSYISSDISYDNLFLPLTGLYQARNAALAVRTLEHLDLPAIWKENGLERGLRRVHLEGRFQVVRKEPFFVVLDVFHNRQGAEAILETVTELFGGHRICLLIGMAGDKDLEGIAEVMAPVVTDVIAVKPDFWAYDREVKPADLVPVFRKAGFSVIGAPSMEQALSLAESRLRTNDVLLVGGSFKTVSAVLPAIISH
jgi:dihydrofolate synthase/folylpolyglutamate synthase